MKYLNWFSRSISRQASLLLILILCLSTISFAFYFYNIQKQELKQTSKQMASQLLNSLSSTNAKYLHFNDYFAAWQEIRDHMVSNAEQLSKGGLYKISEIALLDKEGNTFAHSSPRQYPLKIKYDGILPGNNHALDEINDTVISWLNSDTTSSIRLYDKVMYQGHEAGFIILQLDLSRLKENEQLLLKNFFLFFLVFLIIAIGLGRLFGFWVSYPINRVENSLKDMGTGKLNLSSLHNRHDEYLTLAQQIEHIDKKLFDSQSLITLLLDSTAEAIYGIDVKGNCIFVNKACVEMLGYENADELLGKHMHSLAHHSYADGNAYPPEQCPIYQSISHQKKTHVDTEVLWKKDASCFAAEYWSHPIYKNNECIGAVVTFLDITKRIEAEKIIKTNEKNLAITLNSIGDAVIATDANGNVVRMNPIAEKLTGWTLEEAKGKPLKSIFSIINASTREVIPNPVDKVIATNEIVYLSNHTTLISRDGTEYQIADSAAPIRDDHKTLGMVLVFNDVTEQYKLREIARKSKRDLQAIMDNTPSSIYVVDLKGKCVFINKQFEKLFNIKREDVIGKSNFAFLPKEFANIHKQNDEIVLQTGKLLELEENLPLNGKQHSFSFVKFPLFNESGEIYSLCTITADITQRKLQQEQLHHAQKMDALGKLTGGIAHDYNNILGIVSGYAEQLSLFLSNDKKLAKYADEIQYAAQRGSRLTKKILAFSQHNPAKSEVVNLNTILSNQQLLLEKTLTAKISLDFQFDSHLWNVTLDTGDFEDAVINLCINALHAMENGGQLRLSTHNIHLNQTDANRLQLNAGDYVMLRVADNGCGMSEETKNRIFDPFFTTKGDQGTGLGLSQVYGFVENLGGTIKVTSTLGVGSVFELYFPRSHVSELTETQPLVKTANYVRGSESILVVDDEIAMANLAKDILVVQGFQVVVAFNAEQALTILEKQKVDILITDVIMPQMNGFELASIVKQKYPHICIQLTSGFTESQRISNQDLHDNILYKPYTSADLLKRIHALLDEKKMSEKNQQNTQILVMDDDENIRELFKIKLGKLGYQTILAENGQQTIELYQKSLDTPYPIDILILDLSIPGGMGGKEVAEKIRKLNPAAKIIVASGHSEGDEMKNFKNHGFDAAIEKIFNTKEVQQIIEDLLNSSQTVDSPE